MNQSVLDASTGNWGQEYGNACKEDTVGFVLTSSWLGRWRKVFKPMTEHSKASQRKQKLLSEF